MVDRIPTYLIGPSPAFTAVGQLSPTDRLAGLVNESDLVNNSVIAKSDSGIVAPVALTPNTFLGNTGDGIAAVDSAILNSFVFDAFAATTKGEILVYDGSSFVLQAPGADDTVLAYDATTATGLKSVTVTAATGGGAGALNDLTDAAVTTPADLDFLIYDNGSASFVNSPLALEDAVNVDTDTVVEGDLLVYRSGIWTSEGLALGNDNLGDHTATENLKMANFAIESALELEFTSILDIFSQKWLISEDSDRLTWAYRPTAVTAAVEKLSYDSAVDTFQFSAYANIRDDSGTELPVNFLYTGAAGDVYSAPITELAIPTLIGAMSDVNNAAPGNGQVLAWNATSSLWEPSTVTGAAGVVNLDDLADVAVPSPSTNDYLRWSGTAWVAATLSFPAYVDELSELIDVTITAPAANEVLTYNGSGWVNQALTVPDVIADLSDVSATAPAVNEVLKWTGTEWAPAPDTDTTLINIEDLANVTTAGVLPGWILKWSGTDFAAVPDTASALLSIGDLPDVTLTATTANDYLSFDGTDFVNTPFPTVPAVLNDLTDVDAAAPTTTHVLTWTGAEWEPQPAGGVDVLNDLSDTAVAGAALGDFLYFNGTTWVNQSITLPTVLSDLTDADTTGAVDGDILEYSSGTWVVGDRIDRVEFLSAATTLESNKTYVLRAGAFDVTLPDVVGGRQDGDQVTLITEVGTWSTSTHNVVTTDTATLFNSQTVPFAYNASTLHLTYDATNDNWIGAI